MKPSGNPPSLLKFCLLMLMLVSYTDAFVIGAPKGSHVVSGTASFTQDGNLTVITAGNRSVINYTGFDIGKNETVQFIQPGAHATVLNRVTTPDPTNIFGRLESNGIVVISNPYGVFFQNGSVVNVGGLVAGAGKISNADFTAGKIHFTDLNGDVRNDGVIAADNQIALMGANVVNTGSMTAAHGVAMMVSGPDVYVGDKNGNIFVQANGKALRAAAAATTGTAAASAGSVTNSGTVAAPRVVLGAGDMYSTAIVNSGLLQGRSIAVNAGKNGSATVGGTLDASSAHHATVTGKGGNIDVLGGKIALQGATLDASGAAGGGNVRVGGDFHGAGTLPTSATTSVDAATTIKADATGATGNGGTVVLWSDAGTTFNGNISARGGATGGDGGSAEVSGHGGLIYHGLADMRAPNGKVGSLLLDPTNVVIDTVADFMTDYGYPPGTTELTVLSLTTQLTMSDTIIPADNSIVFRASFPAPLLTNTLTLTAGRSIYIGDPGNNPLGATTTPPTTDSTVTLGGAFNATFNNLAGVTAANRSPGVAVFAMTGGSSLTAPGGVSIMGGNFVGTGTIAGNTGAITLGGITAHGGGITVDNHLSAASGISTNGALDATAALIDTAGGNISLQAGSGLTLGSTVDASGGGAGNGGTVNLSAGAGGFLANSTTYTITSNSTGTGSGGNITLGTTGGNLVALGGIAAASIGTGAGAGHGGAVQLTSATGTVTAGSITTNATGPGNATAGSGQAGNVMVSSNGLLTVGAINATANVSAAASTTTGGGGTVLLNSTAGGISANTINASTGNGGLAAAGAVTLTAKGALTVGTIDAKAAGTGAGGAVQLTFAGDTDAGGATTLGTITTTSVGGTGGAVALTLATGATAATLVLPNIATGGGGAASGAITATNNNATAGSDLTDANALDTTGTGTNSAGGAISLTTTKGAITLTNTVTANGTGTGKGGNVTMSATGGKIDLGTNALAANGTGTGAGGAVTLTTDSSLTTGTISATGAGTGAGGVVQTTSAGATSLGTITTTSVGGAGGNVSVTLNNATGGVTPVVLSLPTINTRGATAGGNITAANNNPNSGSTLGVTGALDTSGTGTNATGGNIKLSTAAGNLMVGGTVTTDGAGTGAAGTVQLTAVGGTLSSGAISAVGATGNGGAVMLVSGGTLTPGSITTTSTGGTAGNITLTAPTITLNNALTATGATAAQGGTVTLNATTALNLNSTISGLGLATLATGAGPIFFNDGSAVTTTGGGQTYNGAVTLAQTAVGKLTTLADTGSGDITFGSKVDSDAVATGQSLTVNTQGNEIFGGAVGSAFALNNLTTDAAGTVGGAARFNFALPTGATNAAGVTLTGALLVNDGVNIGVTGGATAAAPSIATGGAQTYKLAATVGATTYLTSGSTLEFDSTLGSATATARALTLDTVGKITLGGGVGTGTLNPLASLTTVGGQEVDLNGGGVTTSAIGGQIYSGKVMLGADTTLTATANGPVTFDSTVDGAQSLTVASGGVTRFENNVGSTTPLTSLSVSGTGGASFTPLTGSGITALAVKTSAVGGQNYTGPVTLGADLTLTAAANGPVVFGSTINGGFALTVATGGLANFGGDVGLTTALTSLSSTGAGGVTFTNPLTVKTSGLQKYTGQLTLGGTTALMSTGSTVMADSLVGGGFDLTVTAVGSTFGAIMTGGNLMFADGTATATFNGNVVATSLTRTGTGLTEINAASIQTASTTGQSYGGPVQLDQTVTFSDTASGAITFSGAVNGAAAGAQALTVVTNGATTFDGTVGLTNALGSLTVGSALVNSGTTTFDVGASSVTTLNDGTATGTGTQTYFNAVRFGLDTTLLSNFSGGGTAGGDITFNGKVDSLGATNSAIAVDTSGNEIFNQLVGSVHPLRSLATDSSGTVGGQVQFNMSLVGQASGVAGVRLGTDGALFKDLVVFNVLGSSSGKVPTSISGAAGTDNPSITSTGGQSQFYQGGVTDQQNTVIQGPSVVIAGTFNAGSKALTFDLSNQALTIPLNLPGTTFTNLASLASVGDAGTTINGDITTTGYQYYGSTAATGGVTLAPTGGATSVTLTSSGGANIGFGGTVNGPYDLRINTAGDELFNGLVGNLVSLTSLVTDGGGTVGGTAIFNMDVTGLAAGKAGVIATTVQINDAAAFNVTGTVAGPAATAVSSVRTTNEQIYEGAVTLGQNTVLTDTGSLIGFASAIDSATAASPRSLTLNVANEIVVENQIGATHPLSALTTNGGTLLFDLVGPASPQTVTTITGGTATGAQTYNSNILLENDTQLSSVAPTGVTTGGGSVTFNGTVNADGTPFNFSVFAGPGTTTFASGTTVNAQKLNIGGANVAFNASVGAAVNGQLGVLTVGRNGTAPGVTPAIDLNNGLITTTQGQTYSDGVLLSADMTLKDTNSQNIVFSSTVDSLDATARSLTLNTAGSVTFSGVIGGVHALSLLSSTATLGTTFNMTLPTGKPGVTVGTGGITVVGPTTFGTTGSSLTLLTQPTLQSGGVITLNGAVTLSTDTSLYSTAAGDITFGGAVDGAHGLALNTAGNEIFNTNAIVGGTTPLTSLTTDALITPGGQTQFLMDVTGASSGVAGVRVGAGGLAVHDGVQFGVTGASLVNPSVLVVNGGTQAYSGAASVAANTFLVGDSSGTLPTGGVYNGGGNIGFGGNVTGTVATPNLTIRTGAGQTVFSDTVNVGSVQVTGADVTFGGTLNTLSALNALSIAPNPGAGTSSIALNSGTVTTSAGQTYSSPVTLGATTTLADTGSSAVSLSSTVDGAFALTVNTGGLTTFGGLVGATTALVSVTTDAAGTTSLKGGATTTGLQNYQDAVTLAADTTLASANTAGDGGAITLAKTVDGAFALTVNTGGLTTFGGLVGATTALVSVTTDAAGTTSLKGGATTTGLQNYQDAVTLAADTTLASANTAGDGGAITLAKTVDGAFALTVNTGGLTTFGGLVGATTALVSVTTDAAGTTSLKGGATTTGLQNYQDAVTLAADTTLASANTAGDGGAITLAKTVDGAFALTVNTGGLTTFGGLVGATTALVSVTTDAAGTTSLKGGVTTSGFQNYNDAVTLAADTTLTTTGTNPTNSAITFNSTVGGAFALTTATAGGNTVFGINSGSVAGSLLTGLTTSALGTTIFNNAALTTDGTQTYQGLVVVQSATRALSLTANTGNIVFDQTLNSTAANSTDLSVTTSAAGSSVTFTGAVGGSTTAPSTVAFNSLTVTSPTININGGVVNTASSNPRGLVGIDGTQTYNGAVFLGQNTVFVGTTVGATGVIDAQNHDLTLTLSGLASVPLAGIINVHNFTSNGTGGTDITGNFGTTGFQHYANVVTVSGDAILTAGVIAGQDSISFGSTVNSAGHFALTLSTAGPITFAGAVGNTDALGSLATTGTGTTNLNGGAVTTVGNQSYAGPVVLGPASGSTTLTTTNGGTIKFGSTLDGLTAGTQALITSANGPTGTVEFDAAVGGTKALKSLNATGTGTTNINGGSVTTTGGGQTYAGPVVINTAATTTLSDTTTGNLLFNSTLDNTVAGTPTLTLSTGGNITFTGQVGNTVGALGNLTASAGGTIFVNGGLVKSTGTQTYNNRNAALLGAVILGNTTTTFASTNSGDIKFDATVDATTAGAQGLIVNTAGNEIFDGIVGNVALASLTTDGGAGTTQFNMPITAGAAAGVHVTGDVTIGDGVLFASTGASFARPSVLSGGSQTYSGGSATQNVFLVGGGTFGNTGTLDFGGTRDLSLRFGGQATVPSGLANVHNFLTDGAGGTLVNGTFTTTGTQTYSDAVTLAGAPVLSSGGNLTFNNPVDGNAPLSLTTTGPGAQVIFNAGALVGNTTAVGALTVNTTGGVVFGMNAGGATVGSGKGGVNAASVTVASGPVFFNVAGATAAHPSILTTGAQLFQGATTLQQDTFLTSSGGTISFSPAGTIDSALTTSHLLTLATTGAQTFSGLIGFTTPLGGLTTGTGVTNFNMTVGSALAGVRLNGALLTGGAATFDVAGSSLTRPSVLTLNNGAQTYGGTVTLLGAVTVLNSANVEPATGTFHGGGTITFNGDIVSGVPVNAAAGTPELDVRAGAGTVEFDAPVTTTGDFAPGGASVIFRGSVGPLGTFTVLPNDPNTGIGGIDINGGSVTTGGSQTYNFATVLSHDTILQAGGNITFVKTLDGSNLSTNTPYALDIKVSGGTIAFNGIVGGLIPLLSLTTENVGATVGTTLFNMTLPLAGSGQGGVNVINAVNIGTNADFEAVGLAGGAVPTILSGVTYHGLVGTGTQTFGGAVTLGLSSVLHQTTVLQDITAAGSSITFNGRINGKVDGDAGLSVNSVGDEVFNQLVGDTHTLASLSTDDVSGGTGATRFNMDLTQPGAAAGVRVAGTVGVNDRAVFNATGGLIRPTILSGGAQNYALAATVRTGTVLTIDLSLRTAGLPVDNGNVIFQSTVDSGATAQDLQVNSPGNEIFKGLVGNASPLASLTTDATGPATGQTRFLMTRPAGFPGNGLGGVNVTGNLAVNDGVFFQVGNSLGLGATDSPSVTTGGTQTYAGPATLGDTTTLFGNGGVAFNSTVDSDALGTPRTLSVSTPLNTFVTFAQPVGGAFPLGSLYIDGLGTTQINGGSVTTTVAQTYLQAVTLGQDTTLLSTNAGSNVSFFRSLDGSHNLTVTAPNAMFNAVGATSPLLDLTVNASSGANFFYAAPAAPGGGSVNLAGRLTVNGPAIFQAAGAGNVNFVRTGVTVPAFNLASGQDYLGSFRLLGAATFTDLKSGPISFRQTVDGFALGNPSDLTVSTGGTISFLGSVGGVTPLTSLTTSNLGLAAGRTIIGGGSVTTSSNGLAGATGAQTYNDAVVLGADAVLISTSSGTATTGGDIVFNSTLDSNAATPQSLVVNTSGRTVFGGAVGTANALASLTTDNEGAQDLGTFINGGSVTTINTGAAGATGTQTYNDAVTLGAATTLTSGVVGTATTGGKIAFNSTLDSNTNGTPQSLVVNTSGRTVFGGAVGAVNALASLTTDNEGAQDLGTFINGGSVTTTGAQTYNDGVAIGAATTLTSTAGGDVAFNSTLDSNTNGTPQSLVVNTSGRTVFGGAVGAANALASITTDNEGPQDQGTFLNGGSVTTTGAQTYNDAATLGANAVLTSRSNGTLVFNNTVNGAFTLTLNTGGLTIFNRAVGGVTPLKGLTTDNAGAVGEGTQFNMIVGNNAAGVVVNGPVTINDAVLFDVKGSSLTQPGVLILGNGFGQTYNGPATLGTSTFLVSAAASSGGGAFTGGGFVRFNSPQGIVANGGSDLTVRAGVGTDTLAAALNVGTLDLGGASATFLGPVTLPGTLSVEPNDATGGGSIAFTGATVTTSGAQLYNAAFVLGSDAVLTSLAGGSITFASTVDGAHALSVNSAGDEIFNARVGGGTPLTSLTTDDPATGVSGGHVVFNVAGSTTASPSVTTTGLQTYNDAALLRADTVLASTGAGVLTFRATVDSYSADTAHALTLNTASDEVFNGQVGGTAPLLSLLTDDPAANATAGRAIFNLTGTLPTTPTVITTGFQTYNDAVLVQTGTTLTSVGGGALTFVSAVDGPASLTVDTAGTTTFRGAVGSGITLASLTTQGGGAVALDGGTVTTTGLQTYGGVTTLGADTVLTSTATGGGIFFARTVDSDAKTTPRSLTLNAVGDETFNGRVGSLAPLASLTTDDPGSGVSGGRVIFRIGGGTPSVTTVGAQTYHDAALLQATTVLASSNGGTLTFTSTVDGPFDLTLNTTGNEVFGGTVGGTQPLLSLTTDATSAGGQVIFGLPGASAALSVTTTGFQTYNDAVLLQTGTTLTNTSSGALTFNSTVDGPFALSLNSKGDEVFNGQIGHNQALASLSTDADPANAGGNVRFFFAGTNASPSVTTTGAQSYRDAAVLYADTVLASTGGGRLAFLSTVDNNNFVNPHNLTLNTGGDELFGGLIGAAKAIGDLTVDATGAAGGQTQFALDLTGQAGNAAGVNVNGAVTINDAVAFNAPGVNANHVLIQSTGAQTYNGPATVGADAVLVSTGGAALTFNSTIVGPHNLTLNTGGATTFNAAVGSGTGNALASLTSQGGPVVLNAGTVNTTGEQVYSGAVALGQNTTLTSSAGGIDFGSTVDGNVAFTLTTANATTFGGAVGGQTPLTNLTATDGSAVAVNGGLVATEGLQTYGGILVVNGADDGTTILRASNNEVSPDVTQHGNIVFKQDVTVNSGSLLVQGRRILAQADADISVAGAGNLDLEADDILILRGANYGSVSGNVILNDPQNGLVPDSMGRATIFLTNTRTVFHGGNFDMGYLQNMFSEGAVSINVSGQATLSDIAASGALNVTAGSILLRARNADPSRGGATGGADDGLNFVSRTSINFGNTAIKYDNTHSSNDVANFVTTTGLVTVNRDRSVGISLFQDPSLAALFQQISANTRLSDDNFASFNNFPFQPISGGTQTIDTAAALSGALPDQKPLDVAVDITVTAGQLEELKKLGIHPRRAARQEKLSLSSKRALFAQLVDGQDQDNYGLLQPIKGGISRLVPSDYVVVVDRMSEREVQSILTAFEELYGKNKEKAAPIGESFNTAFTDYTTEKQTGDPAGFAPYLLAKPGKYPEVDKAVRGFDNLFGYIESLGLTSKEQAKSKEHIASDLQVAGVSPEDMVKVIDTLRAKIPKEQKAPSTKLPPSPPATAPAPGATNPPTPTQKATPPLKTARQPAPESTRKTVRHATRAKEDRHREVAGL